MSGIALIVFLVLTALALIVGIVGMARGASPQFAQRLMRYRVWMQGLAVAVAAAMLLAAA